jgi:hypothetical protein
MILKAKNVFIVVNAILHWINNVAAYFCHSCLSEVEYNCALIKLDWLAACMVDAVLVFFSSVA